MILLRVKHRRLTNSEDLFTLQTTDTRRIRSRVRAPGGRERDEGER
jgi:hypothetical protein